jgi:hypothetical protein
MMDSIINMMEYQRTVMKGMGEFNHIIMELLKEVA